MGANMQATSRRTALSALIGLLAALALLAAPASAAAALSITSPSSGETVGATVTYGGETEELLNDVTVHVYEGSSVNEPPVQSLVTTPTLGGWTVEGEQLT